MFPIHQRELKQQWKPKMMASTSNAQKEKRVDGKGLIDLVFSWSLSDVLNQHLYKGKVEQIPMTFTCSNHYMKSFIFPLIEETHADLLSKVQTVFHAPTREILYVKVSKDHKVPQELYYNVFLKSITLADKEKGEGIYEPEFGDLIALTDVKPRCISDLNRPLRPYLIALVTRVDDVGSCILKILSSKPLKLRRNSCKSKKEMQLFAVHLTNMTTNIRIWMGLHSQLEGGNTRIIQSVLQSASINETDCIECLHFQSQSAVVSNARDIISSYMLDDSQKAAVLNCLVAKGCDHQNSVKLIWGPPRTGKTKTVASLLYVLLKNKCRTLTCAPTNISVLGITKRLMGLVTDERQPEYSTYGLGDIVLFGNGERMKIDDHEDLSDVFLDNRVQALAGALYGWRHSVEEMTCLLEEPELLYRSYVKTRQKELGDLKKMENNKAQGNCSNLEGKEYGAGNCSILEVSGSTKKKMVWQIVQVLKNNKKHNKEKLDKQRAQMGSGKAEDEDSPRKSKVNNEGGNNVEELMTFEEFIMKRFKIIGDHLKSCFEDLYTHLPTSYVSLNQAKEMIRALVLLETIGALLQKSISANEDLRCVLNRNGNSGLEREKFLNILKYLTNTLSVLPDLIGCAQIRNFCLKNARLIFCTASSSAKLHTEGMALIELVIIDEAAQLKECESTIPLQLCGLRHAILVGDERQLPAMVQSKMCEKAGFGRSLFERLVILGKKKHMLEVQYRMHPSISMFPNKEFYDKRILDGPSVKERKYEKRFLQGTMYGPYSFINVAYGEETLDNWHSTRNMVEVAVVAEIVASLSKESIASRKKMRVGCISPYKAQVFAIQEKLGKKYSSDDKSNFSVTVRSVDGFQGGEEDIIIISTVRYNGSGSVGFMTNLQRTNVALTRARHCLWVLGNGTTLVNSGSVWKKLVVDAKERGCYYNAVEDKNLAHAVAGALVELNRFDTLLKEDCLLFSNTVWKVQFSDNFKNSMSKIKSVEVRKNVISLLEKLLGGWRLHKKNKFVGKINGASSEFLEVYKVNGLLNLVWSIEVIKETSEYIQTLKVWDLVSLDEIPKLAELLDTWFGKYTVDTMHRCKYRRSERNLAIPMTWPADSSAGSGRRFVADANGMRFLESRIASLDLKG